MISVIVPVFNAEKYLEKCVNSILGQTYTNFELLLIDDGSIDNSPSICDKFSIQDSRVVVVHKKNEGVSATRNIGISMAKGEYITFVDSDDYLEKNYLYSAISNIKNVDMYLSGITMEFFEKEVIIKSITYNQEKSSIMTVTELLENLNLTYQQICICGPCCKLYKSEIIKSKKIFFDEQLSLGEDTMFNLDYLKNIEIVYFEQNSYYHYRRINDESLFSSFHSDIYETHIKVYNTMRVLINDKHCSNGCIKRFENMYTNLLIGCIHHIFKFSQNKDDRVEIINKVVNNEYVKLSSIKNKVKNRFIINCVKRKRKRMLYFIFFLRYARKELK